MKRNLWLTALFASIVLSVSSCAAIGGIFKAGMWVGIIVVVVVVALVLWLISKVRK